MIKKTGSGKEANKGEKVGREESCGKRRCEQRGDTQRGNALGRLIGERGSFEIKCMGVERS